MCKYIGNRMLRSRTFFLVLINVNIYKLYTKKFHGNWMKTVAPKYWHFVKENVSHRKKASFSTKRIFTFIQGMISSNSENVWEV